MQRRKSSKGPPEHSPAPTPSRAVYGFVLYLLCYSALLLYLTWALLPDSYLQAWGLDFLPQKYWAVALPTYLTVLFLVSVTLIYPSLGLIAAHRSLSAKYHTDDGKRSDQNCLITEDTHCGDYGEEVGDTNVTAVKGKKKKNKIQ